NTETQSHRDADKADEVQDLFRSSPCLCASAPLCQSLAAGWQARSAIRVVRSKRMTEEDYLLSLSTSTGSDLSRLAAFSTSLGSVSGRTMRKPRKSASVKYQMLCGT